MPFQQVLREWKHQLFLISTEIQKTKFNFENTNIQRKARHSAILKRPTNWNHSFPCYLSTVDPVSYCTACSQHHWPLQVSQCQEWPHYPDTFLEVINSLSQCVKHCFYFGLKKKWGRTGNKDIAIVVILKVSKWVWWEALQTTYQLFLPNTTMIQGPIRVEAAMTPNETEPHKGKGWQKAALTSKGKDIFLSF